MSAQSASILGIHVSYANSFHPYEVVSRYISGLGNWNMTYDDEKGWGETETAIATPKPTPTQLRHVAMRVKIV